MLKKDGLIAESTLDELDAVGVSFARLKGHVPMCTITFVHEEKLCVVRGHGDDFDQAFSEARLSLLNERARLASGRV